MRIWAPAVVCLFFVVLLALPVKAQEGHIPPGLGGNFIGPWTVGLQARYTAPYQSFTRANDAFPYRAGEMLCLGEYLAVDVLVHLEREWFRHYFMSTLALPAALRSPDASAYQRLQFQYYFNLPLYRRDQFRSWYGMSSLVLYEKRELSFVSGLSEDKWDVNIGLGPTLAAEVFLSRRFAFRGEGHLLFFPPFASYGELRSLVVSPSDQPEARDGDYQNFFVTSMLDARLKYFPSRHLHLHLGYRFVTQNGHAVHSAGSVERLAYKLDRLHEFYIGLHLNIPSTWMKRKPNPPCPLSG